MSLGLALLTAALAVTPALPPPAPASAGRPAARPVRVELGVVSGTLRHRGCASAPTGATVTVIGRDAAAQADAEGRFRLELPAGSYSLVFEGPGLVPGQRVDELLVPAGAPRDLGTVELWPEEPQPGCSPTGQPPPQAVVVAVAPDAPTFQLPGTTVQPALPAPDQIWVRGPAGSAPGQFGLQGNPAHDDEDALGPPSFAVGPQGSLWVLDPVNARIQHFDVHGHFAGAFPAGRADDPAFEEDLAVSEEGQLYLFHQNDVLTLSQYDPSGRLLLTGTLPPAFKGVDLLFARGPRPVFLMLNGQAVKADLAWGGLRADGPFPGLPVAGLFARADRLDRWRASLTLSGADGRVRRSLQLHSLVPVTGVRLVGANRHGDVVVALDRGEAAEGASAPAEVLLLAVDQHGHVAGHARVPPGNRRFEFREFALAPDGTVVQMQSDTAEVRFVRWPLHPGPDAAAGAGAGSSRKR